MSEQHPIDNDARVERETDDGTRGVLPDLAYRRLAIVNVAFYGMPGAGDRGWVLIDAGIKGMSGRIADAASERFGEDARPSAIVMTHGHFDHVGALEQLAEAWDVPVYAHREELPYLNGTASYPPADPSVGGGMMAALSRFYPRGPVNVSSHLRALPEDGSVPGMPGWRWIHTPGHTPGHVSLWREADRALIAGDAFITTDQESAYAVLVQREEVHGPPMYYTIDWSAAKQSVERLAALEPEVALTMHGRALGGDLLRDGLHALALDFDELAIPERGRYVEQPARPGGAMDAYQAP